MGGGGGISSVYVWKKKLQPKHKPVIEKPLKKSHTYGIGKLGVKISGVRYVICEIEIAHVLRAPGPKFRADFLPNRGGAHNGNSGVGKISSRYIHT